jgi:anti-sigma factor RsiW
MLHPDEGIIHELLDGELAGSEAESVRRHLAECGDCRRLYEEAQELVTESDRAIALLDDTRPELNEGDAPEAGSFEPGLPPPPAANVRAGPPIVLMPSAPQAPRWRQVRPRNGLWAAALLLLAGGGYLVFGRGSEPEPQAAATPTLETFPLAGKAAAPVTDSDSADALAEAHAAAALASRPPFGAPAPTPAAADSSRKPAVDTGTTKVAAADRAPDDRPAGAVRPKPVTEPVAPPRALAARSQRSAGVPAAGNAAAEDAAVAREAAAQPAAAAAAPPMPPSLETQSGISTRIGLDDARRELGSPLHGIDGLRPRLVGLIPGRLVPGADPSRNVVRAVYLDRNGTPFFLDQQRMSATGGTRPSGGLTRGDVQLFLNGNLSADSAGALAQRIR